MTADVSLEQFVHLKQPACDYLSQVYEISSQLGDLIEALKDLLSLIQEYTKSNVPNTLYQACKYYIITFIYINLT
ncbi:MAG TPA: hypothetical protein VGH95_01065 [Candidatus Aquirickettsiella sp.]|jgi:hypothetical protein